MGKNLELFWHNYKLFPYEKKLGIREIEALLGTEDIEIFKDKVSIKHAKNSDALSKLVYFSHAVVEEKTLNTIQFQYENTLTVDEKSRHKRQNTRYSVHGLHEYKGKFNPQVVRSLFNIFDIQKGDKILDPFCGSGTSLVEGTHAGITALGADVNPLAVMIANTKIASLNVSWEVVLNEKHKFFLFYYKAKQKLKLKENLRITYLRKWFTEEVLFDIEALKMASKKIQSPIAEIFLVVISNLLRDYSLQEPSDLRIRKRKSPFPEKPFLTEVIKGIDLYIHNLKVFQNEFGLISSASKAVNISIQSLVDNNPKLQNSIDFAITSPPYATALPYIDTQRLSLVWLELIEAQQIKKLDSELTGSREFMAKNEETVWMQNLENNTLDLPNSIHFFCKDLNSKLTTNDGFRKKALPSLLYRYFFNMHKAFQSVYKQLKNGKYFALIVGHNHTMIGGQRTEINTPELLTHLGLDVGFSVHEITKLEAYQRYGLTASNAVQFESLIVFKK